MAAKKEIVKKDFFLALDELEREKRIKKEVFIEALESALVIAYKKHTGSAQAIEVKLFPETNKIKILAYRNVVEVAENKDTEISLEDARLISKKYKVGDRVCEEVLPKEFGRIAAQTAKQVIYQKLHEVEGEMAYAELAQKEGDLVTGIVRRIDQIKDGKNVYVEINRIEAMMMPQDQAPGDKFNIGDKVKVFVKKIRTGPKGPQVLVSRTVAGFVRKLFELEVPEVANQLVTIKSIVREAGYRTKMAVYTEEKSIDAVGACVGNRGMRVNAIVNELGGEKIDIISWCPDILEFIARSLSPAQVIAVEVSDDEKIARVVVDDDKLSLAIGRDGQNARLAARLTGWKIDVRPYSQFVENKKAEEKVVEEEAPAEEEEIIDDSVFDEDLGDLD
ncbi:MAG: transcription termination/antitermination protein NusA [Clostridia bacterium]|jgi:N utilization substance protein A|nr:transcription termination/antitermination protein NusA [Clostridia bacterium]